MSTFQFSKIFEIERNPVEFQAVPPVTSYFRKEEQFTKRLTRVEKISFFIFPSFSIIIIT